MNKCELVPVHPPGVCGGDDPQESENPRMVCAGKDLKTHLVPSPLPWARDTFH